MASFLDEIDLAQSRPFIIRNDNLAAISLTEEAKHHDLVKNIRIEYHHIRELVAEGLIELKSVPSKESIADLMTKPLTRDQHNHLTRKLRLTTES